MKPKRIVSVLAIFGSTTIPACSVSEASLEQDTFRAFDGGTEPADGLHLSAFAREVDGALEVLCVKPDWVSDEQHGLGFTNDTGGYVSFTLLDLTKAPIDWDKRERRSIAYVDGQHSAKWTVPMPANGHYALGCEALPTDFEPAEAGFEWDCPVPEQTQTAWVPEPGAETGACTRSSPYYFSVSETESPSGDECGESTQLCTGMITWDVGSYTYYILCDSLMKGVVNLQGGGAFEGHLTFDTPNDLGLSFQDQRGENTCLFYRMSEFDWNTEQDPVCSVVLNVEQAGKAKLSAFAPGRGPAQCSSPVNCHELCTQHGSMDAAIMGCDCTEWCHDACPQEWGSCDNFHSLPCNINVDDYACPFRESDIKKDDTCSSSADNGNFEHVGNCYRCDNGQQCCYTRGQDNGTGSFDICPRNGDGIHGCSGNSDHCDCDVVPLCGCLAASGNVEACEACMTEGAAFWCGVPDFDDSEFCTKVGMFDVEWCEIVGDPEACMTWTDHIPE